MKIRPLDLALIAVALVATVFVSVRVYANRGDSLVVHVSGRDGEWAFGLASDREIPVAGPLGTTIVEIRGGKAAIESSPCPNKTCVLAGNIDKAGQWVACLPNQVFVRLEGGRNETTLDAATF